MALIVSTDSPIKLCDALRECIECGAISTWILDSDGDLTIANPKWNCKAWFKTQHENDKVVFGIITSKMFPMTKELYGVYHGRLAVTILAHFDNIITNISINPLLGEHDVF